LLNSSADLAVYCPEKKFFLFVENEQKSFEQIKKRLPKKMQLEYNENSYNKF
jgi:hypothetical protein